MKNSSVNIDKTTWYYLVCTWFWSGRIAIMPGTFGTIAAFPLHYFLVTVSKSVREIHIFFGAAILLLFAVGIIAIQKFHEETNLIDHKSIVIDEVVGILLTIALSYQYLFAISMKILPTNSPYHVIFNMFLVATVIFRFFDITKPFFIKKIERSMANALGVMVDDLLAGVYSAITIYIIYKVYI